MDFIDIIKVVSQYYVTQDRETYSNQKSWYTYNIMLMCYDKNLICCIVYG
jgi:hypothetical protein